MLTVDEVDVDEVTGACITTFEYFRRVIAFNDNFDLSLTECPILRNIAVGFDLADPFTEELSSEGDLHPV